MPTQYHDYKDVARRACVLVWVPLVSGCCSLANRRLRACGARRLEDLGYCTLWIPEAIHQGVVRTRRNSSRCDRELTVATGIANLWMREPAAMASWLAPYAR